MRTCSHKQDLITANGDGRSFVSVWPGAKAGPAQETVSWVWEGEWRDSREGLGTAQRRDWETSVAFFMSGVVENLTLHQE